MRILEAETLSKHLNNPEKNEDIFVITDNYVLVGDGATGGQPFEGRPGGIVAGERLRRTIENLPADADMFDFADAATEAMRDMAETWNGVNKYRACIQAAVYSRERREIWRIGDCHFKIDNEVFPGAKYIDTLMVEMRSACLTAHLRSGRYVEQELMDETVLADRPWQAIPDYVQGQYQNIDSKDRRAYGTIDGTDIPFQFLECHDVSKVRRITLYTDGFLTPPETWEEGLKDLQQEKRINPLLIRKHKQGLPFLTEKALFDDTTMVSFEVD